MLRTLGMGLLALAVLLSTLGAGGFGAATADRDTSVAVVDDSQAYVGIDTDGCELTNNLDRPVTVALQSDGSNDDPTFDLGPGESDDVELDGETSIEVEGSGVSVELDRQFDCAPEATDGADDTDDADDGAVEIREPMDD